MACSVNGINFGHRFSQRYITCLKKKKQFMKNAYHMSFSTPTFSSNEMEIKIDIQLLTQSPGVSSRRRGNLCLDSIHLLGTSGAMTPPAMIPGATLPSALLNKFLDRRETLKSWPGLFDLELVKSPRSHSTSWEVS